MIHKMNLNTRGRGSALINLKFTKELYILINCNIENDSLDLYVLFVSNTIQPILICFLYFK